MRFSRLAKVAGTLGVTAACMLGMAACSGGAQANSGIAATVNGAQITEQEVTDQIQALRQQSKLTDEADWANVVLAQGLTPAEVRATVIDGLVQQKLVQQSASELGITVDSAEIDAIVDSMKASYTSDEAWAEALERVGYTEETYRQSLEDQLLEQEVGEYFESNGTATDEDLLLAAQNYLPMYDGAKRSSHILIMVDDDTDEAAAMAKANEILAEIESGSISFEDAAREYSEDGSASNGGDVGWDRENSFVTEYTDALADLELDEVSEPFTSEYGVHIVKVTDVYTAPEEITSVDQIPEAFLATITQFADSYSASRAYSEWIDSLKEKASITIYDMPSGLEYDFDVSKYQAEISADESVDEEAVVSESSSSEASSSEAAVDDEEFSSSAASE